MCTKFQHTSNNNLHALCLYIYMYHIKDTLMLYRQSKLFSTACCISCVLPVHFSPTTRILISWLSMEWKLDSLLLTGMCYNRNPTWNTSICELYLCQISQPYKYTSSLYEYWWPLVTCNQVVHNRTMHRCHWPIPYTPYSMDHRSTSVHVSCIKHFKVSYTYNSCHSSW